MAQKVRAATSGDLNSVGVCHQSESDFADLSSGSVMDIDSAWLKSWRRILNFSRSGRSLKEWSPGGSRATLEYRAPDLEGEAVICRILQVGGYYICFMVGFLSITDNLTRLTQKGSPFRWSDESDESFQKLKTALTTAAVLVLHSSSGYYIVYCDVSRIGTGCMLIHEEANQVRERALGAQNRQYTGQTARPYARAHSQVKFGIVARDWKLIVFEIVRLVHDSILWKEVLPYKLEIKKQLRQVKKERNLPENTKKVRQSSTKEVMAEDEDNVDLAARELDSMAKEIRRLNLASIHSEPHAACDICGRRHSTHECQASIKEVNDVGNSIKELGTGLQNLEKQVGGQVLKDPAHVQQESVPEKESEEKLKIEGAKRMKGKKGAAKKKK
nr:uncharacterized protein LOC104101888 [Nicotiana tomentosiformis]